MGGGIDMEVGQHRWLFRDRLYHSRLGASGMNQLQKSAPPIREIRFSCRMRNAVATPRSGQG